MNAIFIKEFRQNGKWAVVAAMVVGGVLATVGYSSRNIADWHIDFQGASLLAVFTVGCVAVGTMLGLLAVWPDAPIPRWSLLTHRPMSRGRIFAAKFLAALALYAMTCAAVAECLLVWEAIPGDLPAPFEWQMGIPILAALAGGACCLSGAALVAARRSALATRLYPLLPVLAVCAFAFFTPMPKAMTFGVLVIASAIFAISAGCTFAAGGEYESQPWAGRALQALVLAGAAIIMVAIFTEAVTDLLDAVHPTSAGSAAGWVLNVSGQVSWDSGSGYLSNVFDRNFTEDVRASDRAAVVEVWDNWPGSSTRGLGILDYNQYAPVIGLRGNTVWFYVSSPRKIEAYDIESRRYIGGLGPSGAVRAPQAPQPFPEAMHFEFSGAGPIFSDRSLWSISMDANQFSQIKPPTRDYTAPPGERILGVGAMDPFADGSMQVIVTQSAIHVGPLTGMIADIPVTRRMWGFARMQIAHPSPSRFVLLCMPQNLLVETDRSGNITSQHGVPPPPMPQGRWIVRRTFTTATAPPLLALLKQWKMVDDADRWSTILTGLVAAGIGWPLLRRYVMRTPGTILWLCICLALGLAGLILLLCTRTAIVRVVCPACGRKRFVTQERCRHCGAPFPAPATTGVEIFESQQAAEVGR